MNAPAPGTSAAPSPRTVATASFVGTTVEYFDFFIYGTAAALVLPKLFFPSGSTFAGVLASFATFAIGFLARPIGGIVFGHYGDRIGRKAMLTLTLVLMGVASFCIGLLPTYASVGVLAPLLLVFLRLVQGFAFGGETGGALLMAYEYAPPGKRGFFTSLPQVGPAAGVLLGNVAFLPIAALPEEALFSWGWRIPFLASILLVIIGVVIRQRIPETPQFAKVKATRGVAKLPIAEAFRRHWREILLVTGGFLGFGAYSAVLFTYMVSFATTHAGVSRSSILSAVLICTAVQLVTIPLGGALSDRFGRGALTAGGAVLAGIGAFGMFAAVQSGNFAVMVTAYVLIGAGIYSTAYGALWATFVEAFDTRVRYSGMSLGFQLSNVFGSGFAPLICTVLLQVTGTAMAPAAFVALLMLISAVSLVFLVRRAKRIVAAADAEHAPDAEAPGPLTSEPA
ncbi:MFS transporter [Pseudonocardia lutea]|uniref:MFS transporter n=1 Tax=Pseudonocardia lutea TaxID=2172015 RepID=A0ABW1I2H2_9PSEU